MDGGTWYPEAWATLGLKHRLHSTFEKSIVKEQYNMLRTELNASMITIFHV